MAGEVQLVVPSKPSTAYFVVRNAVGQYWYTTTPAWESYNAAHWTAYAVSMTQDGSSQNYAGTFPATIATGCYQLSAYSQSGGSPAVTDVLIGTDRRFEWSGSAIVTLDSRTKPADTQAAVTLVATTTNLTNAPTAGDFTATMKTSLNAATPASVVGAVGSVTARVTANTDQFAGQTITAAAGVTIPATIASTTNITSATGIDVTKINGDSTAAANAGKFWKGAVLDSGTAQAGASTTITLQSGANANDNYYLNAVVVITSGTGAGQNRRITGYVGSTKVATISGDRNWVTAPDNTSVYTILGNIP